MICPRGHRVIDSTGEHYTVRKGPYGYEYERGKCGEITAGPVWLCGKKDTLTAYDIRSDTLIMEGDEMKERSEPMTVRFFRLPAGMQAALKARAEQEGRTVSGLIRHAIAQYLRRRIS
jgi:hypothetical protein